MGIFTGTLTFKIYRVLDSLSDDYIDVLNTGIKKNRFKPLDSESRETISMGWVHPLNPLEGMKDAESAIIDEYLVLGLRIDKKNLNKKIFKSHLLKRIDEIKKDKKINRLSKEQKEALEEEIRIKLIKDISPSTTLIEALWNLNSGKIYFGSMSKTRNEDFVELFIQSFNLSIISEDPFIIAQDMAKFGDEALMKKVIGLKPAVFSPLAEKYHKEEKGE